MAGKSWIHTLSFTTFLVVFFSLFKYVTIQDLGPASVHRWRQADSAAFSMYYLEEGMNFFSPGTYNMQRGSRKAAAEFPILYYLVALVYKLFGPLEWFTRWFFYGLFALGLYLFSRMLWERTGSLVASLIPPFLLHSTPVVSFYSFNYLPNVPAFAFLLIAAWFYHRQMIKKNRRTLILFFVFTSLSVLVKVSFLIPFLGFMASFFLSWVFFRRQDWYREWFPNPKGLWIGAVSVIILTFSWYAWARYYNEANQAYLFLIGVKPIWEIPSEELRDHVRFVLLYRLPLSFHPLLFWSIAALIPLACFLGYRKAPPIGGLVLFFSLGSLAFLLLFFPQLLIHDYYFVDILYTLLIVPAVILSSLFSTVSRWKGWKLIPIAAFSYLLVVGLIHAMEEQTFRYEPEHPDMSFAGEAFYHHRDLRSMFEAKGLYDGEELAVVFPDQTPNWSLYMIHMPGYTIDRTYTLSDLLIDQYKEKGATLLIVNRTHSELKIGSDFHEEKYPLVGSAHGVDVFRIQDGR